MTPLAGTRVIELAGLAPAPFCGMVLRDFGADVVRVDRAGRGEGAPSEDTLGRGKRSVALNLKSAAGVAALKRLCAAADVLIDPFRPGVLEKLGLAPEALLRDVNPRLVVVRITGWGQEGPRARSAGHDINYIGITGMLAACARLGEAPVPPVNLLGDFAGGGLMGALGAVLALLERERSGRGQVVDAAMVDGASYIGSFLFAFRRAGMWAAPPGGNLLDGGAPFYGPYRCRDGRFVGVGALEPQFYAALLDGLGLADDDNLPAQFDQDAWPELRRRLAARFAEKTRDEWAAVFDGTDACVAPVLDLDEVAAAPHNAARGLLGANGMPRAAPRLSRTPAREPDGEEPAVGGSSVEEVLAGWGPAGPSSKL